MRHAVLPVAGAVRHDGVMAVVEGSRSEASPRSILRRPIVAGVALLVVYVGLSLLLDHGGFLSTDTGGKVATYEVMEQQGTLVPDLGYWAEADDPTGTLHPLYFTYRTGAHWVNVSTLPMFYAAYPLYRVGGYGLALLVPMLGAVVAAFGGRALARRIGSGDGWAAFWLVGLASPLALYALDLWEHAWGSALMVWAVVVLVDAVQERPRWWQGLAAGAAFGLAFSMRTEALAFAVGGVGVAVVALAWRRRIAWALVVGATAVVGFVALTAANLALEHAAMGASSRAGRATGAAGAGLGDPFLRVREAMITTLALPAGGELTDVALGAVAVVLLGWSVLEVRRHPDARLPRILAVVVGAVYLLRFAQGLGFVPGLLVAAPLAVVGLVLGWPRARLPLLMVLVPLPLVWGFQFTGGAVPQWGGRYMMPTALVAVAVGASQLSTVPSWARRSVVGLAAVVTAFGVLFVSFRTHEVARAAETMAARPEPALVSGLAFWIREAGDVSVGRHWLSAPHPEDRQRAADVLAQRGFDSFAYVDLAEVGAPPLDGWQAAGSTDETWLGIPFRITTYRRAT